MSKRAGVHKYLTSEHYALCYFLHNYKTQMSCATSQEVELQCKQCALLAYHTK